MTATAAVILALGVVSAPARAWAMLLVVSQFVVGLGLAGLFFVALQYATSAGWSVALRRVPEAVTALLPWGAGLVLLVVLAAPGLYAWGGEAELAGAFRRLWLGRGFFLVRAVAYIAAWLVFGVAIVRTSRRQDHDGELRHTRRNVRLSVAFLPVFALTVWLASYDWLMSLDPGWYSTIFGVYNFASLFSSGLAAIVVVTVLLQTLGPRRTGPLAGVVSQAHLHDLGKLLFGFTTFWMYIWFSQYMLIWYANIPEEAAYYVSRVHGLWGPLLVLNIALNWVVPFVVLLPRDSKRAPRVMVKVALTVLAGRFLDLYLMVVPGSSPEHPVLGVWELAAVVLVSAGCLWVVLRALARAPVVPVGDPLLAESLGHH